MYSFNLGNQTPLPMKQRLTIASLLLITNLGFGQIEYPKEITPQVLQRIKSDIEKQIPPLKQKLSTQQLTADEIEFSLDTFRIEQMVVERISVDYSTMGMNITVDEKTSAYDKLMNKYYNKLLQLLKPEDKKVLISAQKAWLAYRDAESKLIWTMTKDEYSGGGSMQSNIATDSYSDLVVQRTIAIFNYYNGIVKEK